MVKSQKISMRKCSPNPTVHPFFLNISPPFTIICSNILNSVMDFKLNPDNKINV